MRFERRQGFLGSRRRLSRGSHERHWEHLQRQLLHLRQDTINIISTAAACNSLREARQPLHWRKHRRSLSAMAVTSGTCQHTSEGLTLLQAGLH